MALQPNVLAGFKKRLTVHLPTGVQGAEEFPQIKENIKSEKTIRFSF